MNVFAVLLVVFAVVFLGGALCLSLAALLSASRLVRGCRGTIVEDVRSRDVQRIGCGLPQFISACICSAAGKDGQRLSAERMDHASGVNAASAGRFVPGLDVGAILERQPVHGEGAVECGIDCESDDQYSIVVRGGSGFAGGNIRPRPFVVGFGLDRKSTRLN